MTHSNQKRVKSINHDYISDSTERQSHCKTKHYHITPESGGSVTAPTKSLSHTYNPPPPTNPSPQKVETNHTFHYPQLLQRKLPTASSPPLRLQYTLPRRTQQNEHPYPPQTIPYPNHLSHARSFPLKKKPNFLLTTGYLFHNPRNTKKKQNSTPPAITVLNNYSSPSSWAQN